MRKGTVLLMSILCSILVLVCSYPAYAQGADEQLRPTGLILLTPQEADLFRQTHTKVEAFAPNAIAVERINQARAKKGLPLLPEWSAAPIGKEIRSSRDAASDTAAYGEGLAVDNSKLKCFPPIGNQKGLGSCTTFATTYYQLTHMVGLIRHPEPEWDQRVNPPDYTKIYSPRWTYNFQRNSENGGSSFWDNYNVLQNNGACTWATFSYDGVDYRSWCTTPGPWEEAINQHIDPISYIIDDRLDLIKAALVNGYVLTFGTYVNSWQYTTINDNPGTEEDNPYIGKNVAYWVKGTYGGHGMTIVGYNDAIWADVNRNRKIDDGELGAFRIANSWGTSATDDGFKWLAYDALKEVSSIMKAPSQGRVPAFPERHVYVMTLKPTYTPKLLAFFTMSHAKRNQLLVNLGISDTTASEPTISWYPGVLNFTGGEHTFDGTITACDATFALDFTDILLPESVDKKYYLSVFDSKSGDPCTLKGFFIKDYTGKVVDSGLSPTIFDGGFTSAVTYMLNSGTGNYPPLPMITALPMSGPPPLTVNFNGTSTDSDGYIAKYIWLFGDTGSSPVVAGSDTPITSHTYADIGLFCAKLTVTDNTGASSSRVVLIAVGAQPGGEMHIKDIIMSAQKKGVNSSATAKVTIVDASGSAVSGAAVYGDWSGATTQTVVSGVTDSQGIATITSNMVKNPSAWFTFAVKNIVKDGWTYNASANKKNSGSVAPPTGAPAKTFATALYLAYPDPSNPETWIPYQLAEDVDVTIKIYNLAGNLVRTLDLGHKSAGSYITKDKSAYWDGKNEADEFIASGIYFYAIKAGDFTATKKMVIQK